MSSDVIVRHFRLPDPFRSGHPETTLVLTIDVDKLVKQLSLKAFHNGRSGKRSASIANCAIRLVQADHDPATKEDAP